MTAFARVATGSTYSDPIPESGSPAYKFHSNYVEEIGNRALPYKFQSIENYCKPPPGCSSVPAKLEIKYKQKLKQFQEERTEMIKKISKPYLELYCSAAAIPRELRFRASIITKEKTLPIVLGGEEIRTPAKKKSREILLNFGYLWGEKSSLAVRELADLFQEMEKIFPGFDTSKEAAYQGLGGILCEETWNLIKNDMFVLGAILGERDFHVFKYFVIPKYLLWDKTHKYPRVLAREIIILMMNEYYMHVDPKLTGISFFPSKKREKEVSYTDLLAFIESIKDWETLKKYLEKYNIPFDERIEREEDDPLSDLFLFHHCTS